MFNEIINTINTYRATAVRLYTIHTEKLQEIESTYSQNVVRKYVQEENTRFSKQLEPLRATAKVAISQQIGKARRYVDHQLSHIDVKQINEIRSLQGLSFGAAEIEALRNKYNNTYWTQKTLTGLLNSLLPPTAQIPDSSPDYVIELLNQMESDLNFALDRYDGRERLDSTTESIACERILSVAYTNDCAANLNINPAFTEERIEGFYRPLSEQEDRELYRKFFVKCDTDFDKRQKAAELVNLGIGEMLERSGRFSKYLPADYEPVTGVQEM